MTAKHRAARQQQIALLGAILTLFGGVGLYELVANASGRHLLTALFGLGAWPFACFLIGLGLSLVFWSSLRRRLGSYWYVEALLGLLLVYLSALTMVSLSLVLKAPDPFIAALDGRGGGLVGWTLSDLSIKGLGLWPTWAFWGALFVVGWYLIYLYTPLRLLTIPGVSITWIEPEITDVEDERQPSGELARKAPATPPAQKRSSRPTSRKRSSRPKAPDSSEKPVKAPAAKQPRSAKKKQRTVRKPQRMPTSSTPVQTSTSFQTGELPPLSLLQKVEEEDATYEQARIMAKIIEETLANFDIPAKVVEINVGPTVTQFGVQPGEYEKNGKTVRVRISKIVALEDDLALALSASPVRIEAPVPGKPYIGIEVPNPAPTLVTLRSLLEDPAFQEIESPLAIPLGRDVSGGAVAADLHKLPHLLIAGATGSGKSVAMNAIICGLLFHNGPERVQMIMVDPKRVEFPGYNGIPHLIAPVVTDPEQASGALSWLLREMDERYQKFEQLGVRNIDGYNAKAPAGRQLPYIVMFVDELADLMMVSPETIEAKLVRLAQMARATGIHLVVATQRPSVDVVTGLIKANFPARLAFAVSSQVDSRVILDEPGAEKLLGRGDAIFMAPDTPEKRRIQGCFVSDEEIRSVAGWWQARGASQPTMSEASAYPWSDLLQEEAHMDDLFAQAVEALRGRHTISVSALQRMLNVGYPRAARLMEDLEAEGVVAPDEDGRGWVVMLEG